MRLTHVRNLKVTVHVAHLDELYQALAVDMNELAYLTLAAVEVPGDTSERLMRKNVAPLPGPRPSFGQPADVTPPRLASTGSGRGQPGTDPVQLAAVPFTLSVPGLDGTQADLSSTDL